MDFSDPAVLVIERLERSEAYQQQTKTQDELSAITKRIKHTLEDYEKSSDMQLSGASGSVFMDDLKQLDVIVKDKILKNEYQQKFFLLVTGYKQLCSQRMEILSQISDFFNLYSSEVDSDVSHSDDYLDGLNVNIRDTMSGMESLLQQLSGSSRNVIDYMEHLHFLSKSKSNKHRKKMEKTIQQNKVEISKMTEKLQKLQKDLLAREDKIELLSKNVDEKRSEAELLKRQASTAKNNFEAMEKDWKSEKEELMQRMEEMKKELEKHDLIPKRKIDVRLKEIQDIAMKELYSLKDRILTESLEDNEIREELAELFSVQLQQMREAHDDEILEWRTECISHVHQILEIEVNDDDVLKLTQSPDKEKPISPYHTSSACSIIKAPSDEVEAADERQDFPLDDDLRGNESSEEVVMLKNRLHSMDEMLEKMNAELMKHQEEKVQMLTEIDQLKQLQEATESDALETLENLTSAGSDVHRDSPTQKMAETNDSNNAAEPSIPDVSQAPPSSGASLVQAYRQKIAERKATIAQQQNRIETPRAKRLLDKNLLEEHLRTYRAVINFKEKVAEVLSKEPRHEARAHAIHEASTIDFDTTENQVQIHLARMSSSVESVLAVVLNHFHSIVSTNVPEQATDLQRQLNVLQDELLQTRSAYERRTQHDAAMIMHMQNTLSETQRGNTAAAGTSGSGFPSSPAVPAPFSKTPSGMHFQTETKDTEATIMFSRQDAQHNERVLKKAAVTGKIAEETLTSVTAAMTAYSSISRSRIQQLASKLVHHNTMKEIETNVRGSNLLTSEVFSILEKMEALQQCRAQLWARGMDDLTSERKRLAILLHSAFQHLEKATGVFLIKPLVSFPGNGPLNKYTGKISTKYNKYQVEAMLRRMLGKKVESTALSASKYPGEHRLDAVLMRTLPPLSNQSISVAGLRAPRSVDVWRVDASLPRSIEKSRTPTHSPMHLPRLMELDITRSREGREKTPGRDIFRVLPQADRSVSHLAGDSRMKSTSSVQLAAANKSSRSPDYKSGVPPTTPASPQVLISPSHYSDDGATEVFHSTPYVVSSKSAPDMNKLLTTSPKGMTYDVATSPLVE